MCIRDRFLSEFDIDVVKEGKEIIFTSTKYEEVFYGLSCLAHRNDNSLKVTDEEMFDFVTCNFTKDHDYLIDRIEWATGLPNQFFRELIFEMNAKGFQNRFLYGFDKFGIAFEYQFYNSTSGIAIYFYPIKVHQLFFSPQSMKSVRFILQDFNNLPTDIQEFIYTRLNQCVNCLGCTKNGRSKVLAVPVKYNNTDTVLCPESFWAKKDIYDIDETILISLMEFTLLQEKYHKK